MNNVESRYTHLLQPIRDLTKNWEVDVASQLEEYLEELDQLCITFDGGRTTMNFAEAALLIQGSACIYSKKVEYLYTLVYQALDLISNKKRNQQPASLGEDGVDKDATSLNRRANREEEFLSLDDLMDSSRANLDLRQDCTRNAVSVIPLTPMALVPAEEQEKKNNPLCSHKGEILASRKDFRMNTCTPHASGAFILDLSSLSPTNCLNWNNRQDPAVQNAGAQDENGNVLMQMSENEVPDPLPVLNFSEEAGLEVNGDCGEGGGAFLPLAEVDEIEMDLASPEHIQRQKAAPDDRGYLLRERAPSLVEKIRVKEILDPWRCLNPFESSEDKPFKKGKHYLVPRNLDETTGNKRKRKGSIKLLDFMKWFSGIYYNGADVRKSKKRGPTFADMEVLYWNQVKERLAAQKKLQRKLGMLFADVAGKEAENMGALENAAEEEEELLREEDYLDHDGFPDDDYNPEDIVQPEVAPVLEMQALAAMESEEMSPADRLSYEDLVRRNVERFIANSQKYARETELSLRVRDWEDKIGPQLQDQEERGAFDIHDYGDRIVAAFDYIGERRSFVSLTKQKPAYEVCRYMLAALQLANDCTVEVSRDPRLHEGVDTMELKLLSRQRAHERFKAYVAPLLSDN
ncbi:condensin-2 complex subunit H2 [Latimeria chalumnae]|uniref:condensin-2 complex subunit H2 n=1 Tax=Latimeria chalumnae TaxID=7897 RepID=UPI00313E0B43